MIARVPKATAESSTRRGPEAELERAALLLDVDEAERTGAGVGSQDGSDLADLDLHPRHLGAELVAQLLGVGGRAAVHHREALERALRLEALHHRGDRLGPGAGAVERLDLTVIELEQGLDVEHRTEQVLDLADPAAH